MTTSYARLSKGMEDIADGTVLEVVALADGQTPQTNYTPEIAATFIECPSDVEQYWTYQNGQWAPPSPPAPPAPSP